MKVQNVLVKIGINAAIQISGKIVSIFLSFISVGLLTRTLGTEGYGNFTLAFTFVSFFSAIADFGLQSTVVRELSFKPDSKSLYSNFFTLKVILIIASSLAAAVSLFFFPYSMMLRWIIILAIFSVAISGLTSYGTVIFQSRVRLDIVTYIDILVKIATVLLIIFFVILKLNIYYITSTVLIGNFVGLGLTYFLLKEVINFKLNIHQVKRLLVLSFPVGVSTFLGLAYFKIDTIMLSVMKGASEVGMYSLAYKILENLLIVWAYYMASAYPIMANLHGKSMHYQVKELFSRSLMLALGLGGITILGGLLFSKLIVEIFGGKDFLMSTISLRILIFSLPLTFINNLCSDFFIIRKENRIIIIGITISVIFNIICNLYAIPKYGFIGASYVTVASALVQVVYYLIRIYTFFQAYEK